MRTALCLSLLLLPWSAWAEPAPAAAPGGAATQAPVRLDLRAAVSRALALDPQVASALVNYDRGKLAVLRAQLDRLSLKVDASLSEQWSATGFLGTGDAAGGTRTGGNGAVNLSASLQVPLFSGYRVTANVERQKLLRDAASAATRVNARTVALDVLRSYWAVRRVELLRAVSEKALQRYAEALVIVKARVSGGLAPPVDVNRMEARRLREVARLADLTGSAAEGRAQLAVALQLGGRELELGEGAELPSAPPARAAEVDRLLDEATRQRPELLAARLQTRASEEQIRIARSAYFPQLTGMMLLQYGSAPYLGTYTGPLLTTDPNPFTNTSGAFVLGATLGINLFDMLSTRTAVKEARYQVDLQRQEQRRLGRLVELDVRTAHARLLRLYRTRAALLETLELARDTLGIVEKRYKNGDALILDLVDAQLELFTTEADLADSAAAISLTWGELTAATGRLPGSPSGSGASRLPGGAWGAQAPARSAR